MRAGAEGADCGHGMDRVYCRVRAFIHEKELFRRGDTVLVGLSGGADSVCLLSVLSRLREELPFRLEAMHVHHGIRGEEADRDLLFSREFSGKLGIPFSESRADAPGLSKKAHLGLEEAARLLRYEALRRRLSELMQGMSGQGYIAVAHHREDQAETVLHHFFRGSGLRGLQGMAARQGEIIRPLLCVSKTEILQGLAEGRQDYMTDSSNEDLSYTRNRLRAVVLPEAERINAQAVLHIVKASELFRETEELLRELAEEFLREELRTAGGGELRVSVPMLCQNRPLLRKYIFMEMIQRLGVSRRDWSAVHYEALDGLLFRQGGAHLDLPCRVSADLRKKELILKRNREVISMKRRKKL